ncbi:MAG: lysine-sensitive aspartokinase 3 [Gemmatimonadaceae bacterium]|nr:lysine-sensitive aspartokinase 3 [Gemmatimonadaceae bacterium]
MIVAKFGGTSVGDAEAIERAVGIVRGRLDRQPIVVVSALGGATNGLLAVAEQSAKGHLIGALRGVENLRDRHLAVCKELLGDGAAASEVSADLSAMFDELASLAEALKTLGHVTPRSLDAIASIGEQCSSQLVTAVLCERGIAAQLVDAGDVMVTDSNYMQATPKVEAIAEQARAVLLPILKEGKVPVLGGFIGRSAEGITTTLGRGGSDYSASLIGAALHAEAIEIWTDVDGMMTADPRVVEGAKPIERIRFDEASELASFGAKVLHPSTIAPAVRIGIPVYVLNSNRPELPGTLITFEAPRRPVTAIAGRAGITLVRVRAARMLLAHGFLRRVFEVFERHSTSIDVVATSEVSVSMTLDDVSKLDSIIVDLSALGDVSVEHDRGIVAIVGAGISDHSDAMGRALACLNGSTVHMISLSATAINLTAVVDSGRVGDIVRGLHTEFFEGGE